MNAKSKPCSTFFYHRNQIVKTFFYGNQFNQNFYITNERRWVKLSVGERVPFFTSSRISAPSPSKKTRELGKEKNLMLASTYT